LTPEKVVVIGGGLAGSEAAWYLANSGIPVEIWEMRPERQTPAHRTGYLGELVCSNSLKTEALDNASGLLKEEMAMLSSLVIQCARKSRVPAGGALAVDREDFARQVTETLENHPNVTIIRREADEIPSGPVIVATGPLSSEAISGAISSMTGEENLYFYDAAAPIVTAESIDFSKAFAASRYGKGQGDYLNCPMTKEEYNDFYAALLSAERHPLHEFEKEIFFEGCMPIEVMAARGEQTLLFGPLKPVGLIDPKTGQQPYSVVQLRQDNKEGTLFNLVGFQTNLKWPEQKRVFSMIPALRNAEFVRYGVMHRNTFINSPKLLNPTLQVIGQPNVFMAGQITGVEGYVESAAAGIAAAIGVARLVKGQEPVFFPRETAIGSLCNYITTPNSNFQPMNINFGLLPPLEQRIRSKKQRNRLLSERALDKMKAFIGQYSVAPN
jgi:methylenetetrahydrofolate--tRNA-(uracil-5-)-methyltransferase